MRTSSKGDHLRILNAGQNYHITGGSDRYMMDLESMLKADGHDVVPFAAASENDGPSPWSDYFPPRVNFEQPGIRDIINYLYAFPARRAMKRLLKTGRFDIAHLHIYYGQLTSSILAPLKQFHIPIVQTLHEYKVVCPVYKLYNHDGLCEKCTHGRYMHCLLNRCNRGSFVRSALSTVEAYVSKCAGALSDIDHFITVSEFQKQKIVAMGIPEKKITAIPHCIEAEGITAAEGPGKHMLYFGRLEANKGILTMLNAAEMEPEIPLLIAGSGSMEQAAREIIKSKGLSQVKLVGFKSKRELHDLIVNSIATVIPSEWYETFGLTILESFARAVPVIGTDIGAIPGIIQQGVDGLIVPPGDAAALAEAMVRLTKDRGDAHRMGLEARTRVLRDFRPETHIARVLSVYHSVMNNARC